MHTSDNWTGFITHEMGPWGIWTESATNGEATWLTDSGYIIFNTMYWTVAKAQLEICEVLGEPNQRYEIRKIQ